MAKKISKYQHNIPSSDKERIVVIGGGFGGLNLINKIRSDSYQVVLLDRYNYHTFQPLLYQVATAGLEPDSIAGPLRKKTAHKSGFYFRMLRANRINIEQQEVDTFAGPIYYDHLVIATGSKTNFFQNKDIGNHAYPLKQVTHALDLRSTIFQQFEKLEILSKESERSDNMNFVIVGAGPTGVELCGALAELKNHVLPSDYPELDISEMKIFLIEGLSQVLPGMSELSGQKAKEYLEKVGVEVKLETMTSSYDGKTVKFDNGEEMKTNTLIWAAGVKPNLPDGIPDEYLVKGYINVDEFNRLRSSDSNKIIDNVYAIGDNSFQQTDQHPGGLPGLAPVAIQQGRHLAKNFNKRSESKGMIPFKYRNKGVLATIGRNKAVADLPRFKLSGLPGWIIWMAVHLMYLVGFRNKAVVFTNWFWNYVTYDRGIRLILRPSPKSKDFMSRELVDEMKMD